MLKKLQKGWDWLVWALGMDFEAQAICEVQSEDSNAVRRAVLRSIMKGADH